MTEKEIRATLEALHIETKNINTEEFLEKLAQPLLEIPKLSKERLEFHHKFKAHSLGINATNEAIFKLRELGDHSEVKCSIIILKGFLEEMQDGLKELHKQYEILLRKEQECLNHIRTMN